MNPRPDSDDPRDAHLLAALRHAPDRDALPPRDLSQRILAAARAAVQPARAAPWWRRVGAWLVQPQVAASFGTLAAASIVGLMWSTREPPVAEPALRQSAAEQAAATSAVAAPAPAPSEFRRERDRVAQAPAAAPAPKQEAAPRPAKAAKAPVDKADARPAPAPSPEPSADGVAVGRVAAAPAASPAARLGDARDAAADTAASAKASRSRGPTASMPALESSSRQSLPAAGNVAAADPLARIDALLAGGDATWSNDARTLPHGAAQAAWWAELRRATGGAWQAAPSTRADAALASPVTLVVAGQGIASVGFAADSVWWCPADRNACWRALITATQRDAWMAELARW